MTTLRICSKVSSLAVARSLVVLLLLLLFISFVPRAVLKSGFTNCFALPTVLDVLSTSDKLLCHSCLISVLCLVCSLVLPCPLVLFSCSVIAIASVQCWCQLSVVSLQCHYYMEFCQPLPETCILWKWRSYHISSLYLCLSVSVYLFLFFVSVFF